jgi:hypothetical protein
MEYSIDIRQTLGKFEVTLSDPAGRVVEQREFDTSEDVIGFAGLRMAVRPSDYIDGYHNAQVLLGHLPA